MQKNKDILKTLGASYIHYIPWPIIKTVGCFKYKVKYLRITIICKAWKEVKQIKNTQTICRRQHN